MAPVKVSDRVRVADRDASAADAKSGLFYDYFRNLTGSIERVYEDKSVCVDVDIDTLPEDVLRRHKEVETAARDKWLHGLSQEQRSRLTEADKQFAMRYKIVVAAADVELVKGDAGKAAKPAGIAKPAASGERALKAKPAAKAVEATHQERTPGAKAPAPSTERVKSAATPRAAKQQPKPRVKQPAGTQGVKPAAKTAAGAKTTAPKKSAPKSETGDKRLTEKDLAARELAFLKALKTKQGGAGKDGGKTKTT